MWELEGQNGAGIGGSKTEWGGGKNWGEESVGWHTLDSVLLFLQPPIPFSSQTCASLRVGHLWKGKRIKISFLFQCLLLCPPEHRHTLLAQMHQWGWRRRAGLDHISHKDGLTIRHTYVSACFRSAMAEDIFQEQSHQPMQCGSFRDWG